MDFMYLDDFRLTSFKSRRVLRCSHRSCRRAGPTLSSVSAEEQMFVSHVLSFFCLRRSSQTSNSSSEGPCVMVGHDRHPPAAHITEELWVHSKVTGFTTSLPSVVMFPRLMGGSLMLTFDLCLRQPCSPILKSYLSFPIKLRIGLISAFATITVRRSTSWSSSV